MSFNHYARKVRNPALPFPNRVIALATCIGNLCWLMGKRFDEAIEEFGFSPRVELTEAKLLTVLNRVEATRNCFLERLRMFERKRIREKILGRRTPRKADLKKLYTSTQ
jgi:hypothetical protein